MVLLFSSVESCRFKAYQVIVYIYIIVIIYIYIY